MISFKFQRWCAQYFLCMIFKLHGLSNHRVVQSLFVVVQICLLSHRFAFAFECTLQVLIVGSAHKPRGYFGMVDAPVWLAEFKQAIITLESESLFFLICLFGLRCRLLLRVAILINMLSFRLVIPIFVQNFIINVLIGCILITVKVHDDSSGLIIDFAN